MSTFLNDPDKQLLRKPFFITATQLPQINADDKYQCHDCCLKFSTVLELSLHKNSEKITREMMQENMSIFKEYEINLECHNKSSQLLMKWMKIDNSESKDYFCSICSKKFNAYKGLRQHVGKIHESSIKEIKCDYCDKTFKHKYALKFHMDQVHEKVTRVFCSHCDKELYNKYRLESHQKYCLMERVNSQTNL